MQDQTFDFTPALGKVSFACPHSACRAIAHQNWFRLCMNSVSEENNPNQICSDIIGKIKEDEYIEQNKKYYMIEYYKQILSNEFFFREDSSDTRNSLILGNGWLSVCRACRRPTLWKHGRIFYPVTSAVEPHAEMPSAVVSDFKEAAEIVDASPRGACALLRLCVQKLCIELGYDGKNLNADIGAMVAKGLSVQVQRAFDVVRVTGNNAVHPLEMDLKDDRSMALTLFKLVNMIVDNQIAEPKRMEAIFSGLPKRALDAIAKRDAPKLSN